MHVKAWIDQLALDEAENVMITAGAQYLNDCQRKAAVQVKLIDIIIKAIGHEASTER